MMAPPDPAASKLVEPGNAQGPVIVSPIPDVVATAPSANDAESDDDGTPKASLRRTEFGVDLGAANSVNGLRMLWLGLLKSRSNAPLVALRPIIVVRESNKGLGMQLHLVAGPLNDAGAAARICAVMTENKRPCETTIFDGQRAVAEGGRARAHRRQADLSSPRRRQAGGGGRGSREKARGATGNDAGHTVDLLQPEKHAIMFHVPHPEERREAGVSKDAGHRRATWFETRVPRSSP